MRRIEPSHMPEELLEQAAYYLVMLDEQVMGHEEQQAFKAWLAENTLHREAFAQVASVWGKMDVLHGLAEIFPIEKIATAEQSRLKRAATKSAFWKWPLAACLLTAGVLLISRFDPAALVPGDPHVAIEGFTAEIQTSVGEMQTLEMVDGSKIVANTNSRLSVLVTETERRIVLDQGEAYFEVEHDPSRSFDVVVGDTVVRAIGTAFSVYRDKDQLKVVVAQGLVEVIPNATSQSQAKFAKSNDHDLLYPGQVAEYSVASTHIEIIEQQVLARKLIWRSGMLAFDGEPLETVIEEFSRYSDVKLEIGSDAIRKIRVGGYFNSDDVAGMLNALEGNFGVKVTRLDLNHVVLTEAE